MWKHSHRSTYLDEILRHAGRGEYRTSPSCPDCLASRSEKPGAALYRCESECFVPDLVCQECCVRRHKRLPLHRIQVCCLLYIAISLFIILQKWNGSHFESTSLKSMGLKIVLNHTSNRCDAPTPCHTSLVVLHTNGIHEVSFQYCGCTKAEPSLSR